MLRIFERFLDPYPDGEPTPPPSGLLPFLWACSFGVRRAIVAMTLLTAAIGAFEALLFAMMGHIVDWLSQCSRAGSGTRRAAA